MLQKTFLLFCCLIGLSLAAPPEVTNVRAAQRAGTKIVDITYDLSSPDGGTSTIQIEISLDGGLTYRAPVHTITGAIGENVSAGNNKVASWNAGVDFDGNLVDNCRARVSAFDGDNPTPPVGMVYIPPGTFQIGDDKGGRPPANVTLTKGFFISRAEEDFADARIVSEWNGSRSTGEQFKLGFSGVAGLQAYNFSYYSACLYANAKSLHEGLEPAYYSDSEFTIIAKRDSSTSIGIPVTAPTFWKQSANGYRLPTSAEWEKAARGGLTGKRFSTGDTISNQRANFLGTSNYPYDLSPSLGRPVQSIETHATSNVFLVPSHTFLPNGYGLDNIDGNLAEMTWDSLANTVLDGVSDPIGERGGYRPASYQGQAASNFVGERQNSISSSIKNRSQLHYGVRLVRNVP